MTPLAALGAMEWRRACAAQGWYWTRERRADLWGELPGPFEPIERDLGPAIAAVRPMRPPSKIPA